MTMALFAFAPNWRDRINETLGYATSVVQAVDGTEYRDILRNNPRTTLIYTYTEHGNKTASTRGINANLWRNHADVVICPYWPDGQPITLQSGPGFIVPTIAGREFEVGGYVAAIKPDGVGAYYTITNIVVGSASTAITTNKSDSLLFSAGDMLYPAYEAEINGIVPSSRITASVVEYQVSVELFGRPQKENGLFIYRNAPLLQMPPNRVDAVSADNMRMLAIIESITGRNFRLDQPGREFVARSHDYLIRNRSELSQMRSYFAHMQGRLRSFWVSNFQRDIDVLADVSAGGDALTIRRIDYDTTYDQLVGRTDIAIKLKSGEVIYRAITDSTTVDASTELLEVFPSFPAGLSRSDIAQVSWLDRCRLASDEIEIVWETAEVCRIRLPVMGVIDEIDEPEPPEPELEWAMVSAGGSHSLAIKHDGTLWAWGNNANGRLGDGTTVSTDRPIQIGTDTDWQSVSAGGSHSLGIKANGSLWAWGSNLNGRLGDGTTVQSLFPIQIAVGETWQSAAAGNAHSLGIKTNGSLWAWGSNSFGQLGDGTGAGRTLPVPIAVGEVWQSVAAGDHSLAIKTNNSLWAWGFNTSGQVGDGTTTNRLSPAPIAVGESWQAVSAGNLHSLAIKHDGTLWAWGSNANGRLGDGTTTTRLLPVPIAVGDVWQVVSAGVQHSLGIKSSGSLLAWGLNSSGQLGDGTTTRKLSPVPIAVGELWQSVGAGTVHSLAIKVNGSLWSWGFNGDGRTGLGLDSGNTLLPTEITEP